jgi:hypothetical protein
MQTNYQRSMDIALAGQVTDGDALTRSYLLPLLPQISLLTVTAGSETDDLVITVVDDDTGQTYSVTATGSATEATLLTNAEAALNGNAKLDDLFDVDGEVDTNVLITLTARHAGRSYTISATGGTAVTDPVVTSVQAAGGTPLDIGVFVARSSTDGQLARVSSSTTIANLLGITQRPQAAGIRNLASLSPSAVDQWAAGSMLDVVEGGVVYMTVEEAVTPASPVWMRLAQTSSAGTLGAVRASPAGAAQVNTVAPAADQLEYGIQLIHKGKTYLASYAPTDGTTTVADAIDGLYDALVEAIGGDDSATNGIGLTITESATLLTITTDDGTAIDSLTNYHYELDSEAATTVIVVGTADADALDISSVAKYLTSASAGGLAKVQVFGLA